MIGGKVRREVMSFLGNRGSVRSRSKGRAVMLVGVVLSALAWAGMVPGLSEWVWKVDGTLQDELSLVLPAPAARQDLVFVGMDEESRRFGSVSPEVVAQSRALTLLQQPVGNERLDRRIYVDLIDRLMSAGARMVIFDVLFVGSSGNPEADLEFARALERHHDRIVLSKFLNQRADGSYEIISSRQQLPLVGRDPSRLPHEGYVNLWPDAEDHLVRRMDYTIALGELESGVRRPGEPALESLSALTGRLLGAELPAERAPRLRYAVAEGPQETIAAAYAPHSLSGLFVPEVWEDQYGGGSYFKDKVVLLSTATLRDEDHHPIPGGVIYGGQFHLQALGSLLDDHFWRSAPAWVNIGSLLGMAVLAVVIGIAVRHPLAILLASLSIGGGFLVLCAWLSGLTGVLFAGTPGLLSLVLVTICAELGHLVASGEATREEARVARVPVTG